MTNTQTTTKKANHHFRALVMLVAALAMVAMLLTDSRPAHASTTFTVNVTGDTPDANLSDAACDVNPTASGKQCTLRAAIQEANGIDNPTETDRINFNIPDSLDPGVKTISPTSTLPFITEPVIIDGYSQPGSSANTLARGTNAKLLIEINGANSTGRGLTIAASNIVVKGLVINRFSQIGIEIAADLTDLLTNVRIEGNFVGTNPAGIRDRGNGAGVDLFATSNSTVGGTSLATRNLISGNEFDGVFIEGGCCSHGSSDNNLVQGNLIGTQKDGIQALGNTGNGVGVLGDDAVGNRILSNSIFSNGGIGIDLGGGPTPNDQGDTDTGPNRLQNFPVLSSAKTLSGHYNHRGHAQQPPGGTLHHTVFLQPLR